MCSLRTGESGAAEHRSQPHAPRLRLPVLESRRMERLGLLEGRYATVEIT
ncbi:hypothetical protein [Haloterrigena salina]|nr:hypothetical protein [Haloterrigena salina]